jgi:carbonic anhydrase
METFTDEVMRALLRQWTPRKSDPTAGRTWVRAGSSEGDFIDWLTIKDQAESVTADAARIRAHPLVPAGVAIYGYIYDVKSGRLIEVSQATEAGKT